MISLLINLLVAAGIGWVVTKLMRDRPNLLLNITLAAGGAFLAHYFLSPSFKLGTLNDAVAFPTVLATLVGAVILLVVDYLLRGRRSTRR